MNYNGKNANAQLANYLAVRNQYYCRPEVFPMPPMYFEEVFALDECAGALARGTSLPFKVERTATQIKCLPTKTGLSVAHLPQYVSGVLPPNQNVDVKLGLRAQALLDTCVQAGISPFTSAAQSQAYTGSILGEVINTVTSRFRRVTQSLTFQDMQRQQKRALANINAACRRVVKEVSVKAIPINIWHADLVMKERCSAEAADKEFISLRREIEARAMREGYLGLIWWREYLPSSGYLFHVILLTSTSNNAMGHSPTFALGQHMHGAHLDFKACLHAIEHTDPTVQQLYWTSELTFDALIQQVNLFARAQLVLGLSNSKGCMIHGGATFLGASF
ncbi:MAG: hypothetical protein KGM99_18220 [Burkholderiales bacterium]|nr:hypothetical protein [Burkholderiales bacterium]